MAIRRKKKRPGPNPASTALGMCLLTAIGYRAVERLCTPARSLLDLFWHLVDAIVVAFVLLFPHHKD